MPDTEPNIGQDNSALTDIPAVLRSELADDPNFTPLVEEFLAGLNDRLNEIDSAWKTEAWEKMRSAVHQLKGAGGGYGYPQLTDAAKSLEDAAKAADTEAAGLILSRLSELRDTIEAGRRNRITAGSG